MQAAYTITINWVAYPQARFMQLGAHRHNDTPHQTPYGTTAMTSKAAPVAIPANPAFNDPGFVAKPRIIEITMMPTEHPKITPWPQKNQPQKTFHKTSSPLQQRFQDGSGSEGPFKLTYIGPGAVMRFPQTIRVRSTNV